MYAQQGGGAGQMLDKLPMNVLTLGLSGGGALALFVSLLILASGDDYTDVQLTGSGVLSPIYVIIALTAVAITTGDKFRNAYRAAVLGIGVYEIADVVGLLIATNSPDAATVVALLIHAAAVGLFISATFTMGAPAPAAAPATGVIPTVQPQHHQPQVQQPTQQVPQQPPGQQQGWQ